MYMGTPQFKFLDIINYLAAGATYDKWVKTYGAKQTKSWLPFEWFDGADKLDYKGLPPYWCWYSQLRNSFALTPKEYKECKRVFEERGMKTFRDWLEYYNLVFTCKHLAGEKTRIRSHKYDLARIVKRILRFDANSLYPRTMAKEMPCGKEFVEHYEDPLQAAKELIPRMYSKGWLGFAEVDIEVPQDLWEKFEEFPPIFINQSVGEEGVPQHMKDYLAKSGRVATPDQKKLLGVLKAKKVLLYAPLLKWYYKHGLEITTVHRTINYIPRKIFSWFIQEVANM